MQSPVSVNPSMLWFDSSLLTQTVGDAGYDLAEATFDYGGMGVVKEVFSRFFESGWVQRMAFISVSNTIWAIVRALEGQDLAEYTPRLGPESRLFLEALFDWFRKSESDSLT